MTITYTSLLGLTKPDTGTQSGTWGSDVNTGLTDYLDAAVAGAQVISGSQTAVTLSVTVGTSGTPTTLSQAGSGSTGSSQYQIIRCTGNPASTLVIDAPKQDKTYVVINATSTNQTVTLRGGPSTPTTGVNIVAGEKAVCAWNGSDFVKVSGTAGGSNTQVQYNSSGVLAGSSNMTFDGTSLTLGGNPTLSAGTANGVLYLNGSKVATSGSALTFDGTNLGIDATVNVDSASTKYQNFKVSGTTYLQIGGNSNGSVIDTVTASVPHRFYVGGSEGMRLTSTGLGIGTSSPDVKLLVKAGNGNQLVLDNAGETYTQMGFKTGGTARGTIWATATDFSLYTYSTQPIIFWTNATERMRLDSSGNLGIGTSSPDAKLDVSGNTSGGVGGSIIIRNAASNAANNSAELVFKTSSGFTPGYNSAKIAAIQPTSVEACDIAFYTYPSGTGTERMRLDSSGNLGLGVTPSASSNLTNIEMPQGVQIGARKAAGYPQMYLSSNVSGDAYGPTYKINGYATQYRLESFAGKHEWYTAPSGTAGNTITFTQAMTLDASGNLGIGETSPGQRLVVRNTSAAPYIGIIAGDSSLMGILLGKASNTVDGQILYSNSTQAMQFVTASAERARITSGGDVGIGTTSPGYKLDVNGNFGLGTGQTGNVGVFGANTATADTYFRIRNTAGAFDVGTASGGHYFYGQGSLPLQFFTNATERARITSVGNLLVGTTDTALNAGVGVKIRNDLSGRNVSIVSDESTNAAEGFIMYSTGAAAYRFYVQWDGKINATNTTIAGISDQRLKENICDLDIGLNAIMALKPRKFDWKAGKGKDIKGDRGFIAQEFEQVFPDLIDEWKDPAPKGEEPYKSVRQDLIPVLVKAIQEQQALITSLTARVALLEGN